VVAAGSSVVNCLLPVPDEYKDNKRGLRKFYHEKFSPASDVDLFLYGLTEEEAIKKIQAIETSVRDALLTETTTVRTKHAVTICKCPGGHVSRYLQNKRPNTYTRQSASSSPYSGTLNIQLFLSSLGRKMNINTK
jgi:hypothetical protein